MIRVFLLCVFLCAVQCVTLIPIRDNDSPLAAPIEIYHVTDLHGWIGGHPHNKTLDADYGDFASLVFHLRKRASERGVDILFFDTGDLVDGTGFSDATPDYHGRYILPIVEKIPFDGLTIGNHDLGRNEVIDALDADIAPHYNGSYLTSNVLFAPVREPLGGSYNVITTMSGKRVLVLGFVYNFEQAANDSMVIHVQLSIKKQYFINAMAETDIDLVVVLNHIAPQATGYSDLLSDIWKEIRGYKPNTPIVLLSGHSHVEYFKWYDDNAFTLESGCYFQEIGRLRFTLDPNTGKLTNDTFAYDFIPTSREEFYTLSGVSDEHDFDTPTGLDIKAQIAVLWQEFDLGFKVGCSPMTYDTTLGLDDPASAYGLLLNEMVPKVLFVNNSSTSQFFISSTGFLRYNLFEGVVNKNDVFTMCGFNDSYMYFPSMEGSMLTAVIQELNNLPPGHPLLDNPRWNCAKPRAPSNPDREGLGDGSLPYFIQSNIPIIAGNLYDVVCNSYDAGTVSHVLTKLYPTEPPSQLPQPIWYPNTISDTNMIYQYVAQYMQGSC